MRGRMWVLVLLPLVEACSDSTFEVLYQGSGAYADPALLVVDAQWSGGGAHLEGRTFTTTRYATPHSERLSVPSSGSLRVSARLITATGDTLGQVEGRLGLEADFSYGALLVAGPIAPAGVCVTIDDRSPLLDPGTGAPGPDSLFLALDGLPEGSIC